MDNRERVAKIFIDMREMNLATLQRERLIFLLGPRFNPKKPYQLKIVAKQHNTFSENYMKAFQLLRELYWEALRAPSTNITW